MKNFKTLLLVALATFSFASCGGSDGDDTNKPMTFLGTHETKKGDFYSYKMDKRIATVTFNGETCDIKLFSIQVSDDPNIVSYTDEFNFLFAGVKVTIADGDTLLTAQDIIPSLSVNTFDLGDRGFSIPVINATIKDGQLNMDYQIKRSGVTLDAEYRGSKQ